MQQAPAPQSRPAPVRAGTGATRRQFVRQAGGVLLLPALGACGGGGGTGDPAPPTDAAIRWGREAITQALQTSGTDTAAISIALLHEDEIVWSEAFGWADREAGIAATRQTRFNIGSVSKVLAGLTGAILQGRGLIDWDTPVVDYVPGFTMLSPEHREITVRHLLSHASGLPGTNGRNIFAFRPIEGYAADTQQAMAGSHLKHRPGELAVYCNDGFTLFEQVVLAVTGRSYAAFVHSEILAPLGMQHSGYALAPFAPGSFAHAYPGGQKMGQEFVNAFATGGLASTPEDMMKLARLFIGGGVFEGRRIVAADALAQMCSDQTARLAIQPTPEWRWGLGWDSVLHPGLASAGVLAWQKNGGTAFYGTEFFVLPQARMALLVTGSGHLYQPLRIAEGVLLRALEGVGVIPRPPFPVDTTPPPLVQADPAVLAAGTGIYGNFNGPLRVSFPQGMLSLEAWKDGQWTPRAQGLRLRADGWWWRDDGAGASYRIDVLHRLLIERSVGGAGHYRISMPIGQQLDPLAAPLSPAWQARVGTRWQLANEDPASLAIALGGDQATIGVLPDLPGYLLWNGEQLLRPEDDTRARMTVKVPVNHGRDLVEPVFLPDGRLRVGSSLYERLAEAAP